MRECSGIPQAKNCHPEGRAARFPRPFTSASAEIERFGTARRISAPERRKPRSAFDFSAFDVNKASSNLKSPSQVPPASLPASHEGNHNNKRKQKRGATRLSVSSLKFQSEISPPHRPSAIPQTVPSYSPPRCAIHVSAMTVKINLNAYRPGTRQTARPWPCIATANSAEKSPRFSPNRTTRGSKICFG
jgi:hypothetical protein